MRETVRFGGGVAFLRDAGTSCYIELGPDGVLSTMAGAALDAGALLTCMRKDRGEVSALVQCLSEAHVNGVNVDFEALLGRRQPIELPAYAFQRERYWISGSAARGDASSLGQSSTEHPLLSAKVELPDGGELFTGRLSLGAQPWLKDHAVMGAVLFPGTGFVELALAAGAQVGCAVLNELTLHTPLVLGEQTAAQIQLLVGTPDEEGHREIGIRSRPVGPMAAEELEWTQHATGALVAEIAAPETRELVDGAWPPADAEPVGLGDLYERLADSGVSYGPAFQGVQAAWRRDGELWGEVALDVEQQAQAGQYGVHPALFDAALHLAMLAGRDGNEDRELELPFAFSGVRCGRGGRARWRVRVVHDGGAVALEAFDDEGLLAFELGSLHTRPVDMRALQARADERDALLCLDWSEVGSSGEQSLVAEEPASIEVGDAEALAAAEVGPGVLVCRVVSRRGKAQVAESPLELSARVLELIKAFLADERRGEAKLVFITDKAIAVETGEDPDLVQSPVWGLIRSAQSEHPDRLCAIDIDGGDHAISEATLASALASGEPQLAIRGGRLLAARLGRMRLSAAEPTEVSLDPDRTVVITGGTGTLGSLLARHFVATHGTKHMVLLSRGGAQGDDAARLQAELEALGASARIVACDVADRAQLQRVFEEIPEAHPLGTVVHAAGVLDDGVIMSLDERRLERVFAPKVDGAVHLHELTRNLELDAFVLFSSAGATLGAPGQGNYAAANAFLDALAAHRRAQGLPAHAIAWGLWEQASGMTGDLTETERRRLGALGLSSEQALGLFDAILGTSQVLTLALRLDMARLRVQARANLLPSLFAGLIPTLRSRTQQRGSFTRRLAGASEIERRQGVLDLVREQVAVVLGYSSPREVDSQRAFKDAGFTSLNAIQLRNSLGQITGLRLPATLTFDYPDSEAVTTYLLGRLEGETDRRTPLERDLDRLEQVLRSSAIDTDERRRINARLRALMGVEVDGQEASGASISARIESASMDDIFDVIDEQLEKR